MAMGSDHEGDATEPTVASDCAATEHTRESHLTSTRRSTTMRTSRSVRNATEHAQHWRLPALSGDWLLIFRFVGAHDMAATWACPGCKPSWTQRYCQQCSRTVPEVLQWTPEEHYGHCGQSCPCCRYKNEGWMGGCDQCSDLWVLKTVSHEMRLTLRSYNGR